MPLGDKCRYVLYGLRPFAKAFRNNREFRKRNLKHFHQNSEGIFNNWNKEHKVLYFGSDDFSIELLQYLLNLQRGSGAGSQKIQCLDVVYSVSRSKSKGKVIKKYPKIHSFINEHGLNGIEWSQLSNAPSSIKQIYDFGIVASFGQLIPVEIIQQFKRGMFNIHPSLLPRWRGSAPIEYTILNNDKETGISIIELSVGKFDHGRILLQEAFKVPTNSTLRSLTEELARLSGPLVWKVLENYHHLVERAKPQGCDEITYACKVRKSMGQVNWKEHTVDYLDRLNRAIGSRVGLFTTWQGKRVKLLEITVGFQDPHAVTITSGACSLKKETKELLIKCKDGWICVKMLQMEYGVPISAKSFYKSYVEGTISEGVSTSVFR